MTRLAGGFLAIMLCASPAAGQTLRDRISELFTFGTCGRPLCLDGSVNAANGHGNHFIPDVIAGNAAVIGFITDAIGTSASSFPLSASSSGVTWRFVGGLPVKTAESMGPVFAERAHTLGRGRLLVSGHLGGVSYKSLRGTPLSGVVLNFTHQDVGTPGLGDPVLENDHLEVRLDLGVDLLISSVAATWGLTDNLDVSIAIPVVRTSVQGRSHGEIFPFGSTAVHFFTGTPENPGLSASAATFGSATGVGDIALRAKVNLRSNDRLSIGVLGDARLPTGSEDNLLGSGHLALRALGLASSRWGAFTAHANLGYLLRSGSNHRDAVLAAGGFDHVLSPWATLSVEVLSEWEVGGTAHDLPGTVTYQFPFKRTIEPTNIPNRSDDTAHGAIGLKFRTNGPTIVTNALVPLVRGGLQPNIVWGLGLDFSF